ncbi:MAG TPA: ribosomal L7Ae/L30e/S12e/Gadd45 family protein [Longimicrobiales bacterium]
MGGPEAALRLLGLAARAGAVLAGTERVRLAARAGKSRFVVVAADASENSREKLLPLLRAKGIPHVVAFDRVRLGAAVGRSALSAVGVVDPSFAARLEELLGGDPGR